MTENELKPCPFCGCGQTTTAPEHPWSWWVGCKACSGGISHETEEQAIRAYNTRTHPPEYARLIEAAEFVRRLYPTAFGIDELAAVLAAIKGTDNAQGRTDPRACRACRG